MVTSNVEYPKSSTNKYLNLTTLITIRAGKEEVSLMLL